MKSPFLYSRLVMPKRRRVLLALSVCLALLAATLLYRPAALGFMEGCAVLGIDFTKPDEAALKARWSDPEELKATKAGLGWEGDQNASKDIWIESTPVAVGWSWRTVGTVDVSCSLSPSESNVATEGEMYARFSPDKKHWSSWQELSLKERRGDQKEPTQDSAGTLRVPYRESAEYRALIMKYARMEVPWPSDEEAAVQWILKDDPTFFERQLPFIGYVQFLFETHMQGGQRLKAMSFELRFAAGGKHQPPKDPATRKGRDSIPWRFEVK